MENYRIIVIVRYNENIVKRASNRLTDNSVKYKDSDSIEFIDKKYGGTTSADAFWLRKVNKK